MSAYLFTYGTLQIEKVQLETFGRIINGKKDSLKGFTLASITIKDKKVLMKSGLQVHRIAVPSENENDKIEGLVFKLTPDELLKADDYEVEDYRRIPVTLESGLKAWVYVSVKYSASQDF